jgi:Ca2+-binding EF-hand superfamily protein
VLCCDEQVRKDELDLLYRVFDTNRNGFLEVGEVVRHQERLGVSLSDASRGQPLRYRHVWSGS